MFWKSLFFAAFFFWDASAVAPLYSSHYPSNTEFMRELKALKSSEKLSAKNEKNISMSVKQSSRNLHIPPAVLWCLLFQESRLNHLTGINNKNSNSAKGLGQFIQFSFYEINHQLDQYNKQGEKILIKTLGHDVRPIDADATKARTASSYYSIPTAVISSGLFLNNRYLQLKRILDKQAITYDTDLLWVYAAMAYNKGTRSVLSIWKEYRKKKGEKEFQEILNSPAAVKKFLNQDRIIQAALAKIWKDEAEDYKTELKIHAQNIIACSENTKKWSIQ
jgi:hypothetical protein